ncbi:SUF system NifU family Fe-S cluster assembly protein [Frankia sp. CcI156]|uniref:SUF system FeS assembly protein n=1 Tax=Frankia casuarinae (strain DSM 45818 / CECT 9043 / HFP020203 / CcI3) TaxID=106370 RepID=Q2JCF1_FRACC|nr:MULTISPECIES: SUF system NifU family Fe-S cluster assembly protein [Frankia]ABD11041.1 SUF system FeS assembly protein [Frankia casuarinae]ETA00949.1 iron-sulfur cluster biosynthesis protein, NifU-like protein [Frankia sp. CcI6]EYT91057.1 iron-sulfur cluster biosynthesis protein, NifU-like protein [Frankia casuarinae]KDA41939.1 iron-sulfur cluster biosynthesis protein, NifU-like protein [Frankia sp. BMG5.23]KEZ37439.1 SUF system FeS assembly protein, NifU family [Frankia sp. CeD]
MKLDSMYQEIILDHYRNPLHRGLRDPFDAEVHHVNPTCGDEVTLRVKVSDGVVEDVSYESEGCSISQASASVMSDLVIGKSVDAALKLEREFLALMQSRGTIEGDEDVLEDAVAFAGVSKYPARVKCALLSWMAWKDATAKAMDPSVAVAGASTSVAYPRVAPLDVPEQEKP